MTTEHGDEGPDGGRAQARQSFLPLFVLALCLTVIGPCGAVLSELNKIDCGSGDPVEVETCESTVSRASVVAIAGQAVPLLVGVVVVLHRRREQRGPMDVRYWIGIALIGVFVVFIAFNMGRSAVDAQNRPSAHQPA